MQWGESHFENNLVFLHLMEYFPVIFEFCQQEKVWCILRLKCNLIVVLAQLCPGLLYKQYNTDAAEGKKNLEGGH